MNRFWQNVLQILLIFLLTRYNASNPACRIVHVTFPPMPDKGDFVISVIGDSCEVGISLNE